MRQLANIAASLLGLLTLGALVVVLTLTFGGRPREAKPASRAFQSFIQTPALLPSPLPSTPTPTPPSVKTTPPPTATPVFRAEYVQVIGEKQLTEDDRFAGSTFGVAWSPRGHKISFTKVTGQFITSPEGFTPKTSLWVVNPVDMSYQKISDVGQSAAWSPDGMYIAFVAWLDKEQSEVRIFDFGNSTAKKIVEQGIITSWLGNKVIIVMKNGRIQGYNIDTATMSPITDYVVSVDGPNTLAASPNGKYIAVVNHRDLWLINPRNSSNAIRLTDRFENIFGGLVWAPTGDKLAYVADKAIWVTTVGPQIHSQKIYVWPGQGHPWALTWSPDGNVLAFHGPKGISLVNADGSGFRTLVPYGISLEESYLFPVWSPDGTMMAVEREKNLWILLLSTNFDAGRDITVTLEVRPLPSPPLAGRYILSFDMYTQDHGGYFSEREPGQPWFRHDVPVVLCPRFLPYIRKAQPVY